MKRTITIDTDLVMVVPAELTTAMRHAWDAAPDNEDDDISMRNFYRAMLAAVPADLPGVVAHSGEPKCYMRADSDGDIIWSEDCCGPDPVDVWEGDISLPLFTHQPAQPDTAALQVRLAELDNDLYKMKLRADIYEGSCHAYKQRINELEAQIIDERGCRGDKAQLAAQSRSEAASITAVAGNGESLQKTKLEEFLSSPEGRAAVDNSIAEVHADIARLNEARTVTRERLNTPMGVQLAAQAGQEPVAWMHNQDGRVDVIHSAVKELWVKVGRPAGFYREKVPCKVEHYTIPLYAAPPASANDCTEPDRADCPLLCADFCNKEEAEKAHDRDIVRAALEAAAQACDTWPDSSPRYVAKSIRAIDPQSIIDRMTK